MRSFLLTFIQTITNTQVYRRIAHQKVTDSLRYYLTGFLLYTLLLTVFLWLTVIPQSISLLEESLTQIKEQIPQDAVFEFTDNTLSSAPTFQITTHPSDQDLLPDNLIIIDTSKPAESIQDSDTLVFASTNALAFANPVYPQGYALFTWEELAIGTTSLQRSSIIDQISSAQNYLERLRRYLPLLLFAALFIAITTARSIFTLIYAVISRGIGWLVGRRYNYKTYLNLSLHTVILAHIISGIQSFLFPGFMDLFPLFFLTLTLIATLSLPKTYQEADH